MEPFVIDQNLFHAFMRAMDIKFLRWNTTSAMTYTTGQTVPRVDNCNGFIAKNIGDTIAFINDDILYPAPGPGASGESKTVGGNLGEIYLGQIKLRFDAIAPGTNPAVSIEQKFYILDSKNDQIFV